MPAAPALSDFAPRQTVLQVRRGWAKDMIGNDVARIWFILLALAAAFAAHPAPALETGLQFVLTLPPGAERQVVDYNCEGGDSPVTVEYLNAAPNFLAILPVDSETMIFVSVQSGSGVRYVASHYEWRTRGAEAGLFDLMSDDPDAPPVLSCLEANDIP